MVPRMGPFGSGVTFAAIAAARARSRRGRLRPARAVRVEVERAAVVAARGRVASRLLVVVRPERVGQPGCLVGTDSERDGGPAELLDPAALGHRLVGEAKGVLG